MSRVSMVACEFSGDTGGVQTAREKKSRAGACLWEESFECASEG